MQTSTDPQSPILIQILTALTIILLILGTGVSASQIITINLVK